MMNNKMIILGVVIAAVVAAVWLMQKDEPTSEIGTSQSAISNQESAINNRESAISNQESAMHKMALASPEKFQTWTVEVREAPKPLSVPTTRPRQLSEVDKSSIENQQSAIPKEPVAVSDQYFYKDYESMRKEEISNPDSKENREGVVALMKARQRRAEQ